MTIEQIRERIDASIQAHLKRGGKLVAEQWGVEQVDNEWFAVNGECCALSTCLLDGPSHRSVPEGALEDMLGVDQEWICSFTAGFDGDIRDDSPCTDAYDLGQYYRYLYINR